MEIEPIDGWITISGVRVHYLAAGEAGPVVLLLHGGGLDSAALTYRYTIPALAATHRVIAPDLPGYGESETPAARYSVAYYVRFLGQFMEAMGIGRAALAGISMGGGAVLGYALQRPDSVERLALIDSYGLGDQIPGGYLGYLFVGIPCITEASWWGLARSRWAVRKSLEAIFADERRVTSDLVDEVLRLMRKQGAGRAFREFQRNEVGPRGLRTDYSSRLQELRMPTLIVHGESDNLVPVAWAHRAHGLIAGSELRVIPDAGHWPPRERPDEFNRALLEFLR